MKVRIFRFLIVLCALFISLYWMMIEFPSFLFSHKHQNNNLVIYSDKKFPQNITAISEEVLVRLKRSELFDEKKTYKVYITTDLWRWTMLALPAYRQNGGGFCMGFRGSAFIRPSVISENRIIPPGKTLADAQKRDLIYFITHELGHSLVFDKVGYISNFTKLPQWLQEGYPDYIAKPIFDFEENLRQFQNNDWRLTKESSLYVRHHLFVSLLMDKQGLSFMNMVKEAPDEQEIIDALNTYSPSEIKERR